MTIPTNIPSIFKIKLSDVAWTGVSGCDKKLGHGTGSGKKWECWDGLLGEQVEIKFRMNGFVSW